jgi:hypothetical protein
MHLQMNKMNVQWNKNLAAADAAIIKINTAIVFTPLPIGEAADLDNLLKANADMKKRLAEIEAKIPQTNNPK